MVSANGSQVPPHHNFMVWGFTSSSARALYFGSYATREGAENCAEGFRNTFGLGGWYRGLDDVVVLVRA